MVVTGASEQSFPKISVQFEVKRPDGSFLLDAGRGDFRVTEDGRDVDVVEFQAPRTKELIPTTLVLVVDRSKSMEEEDRIGGLKRAVASFLEKLPEGSQIAVIAFGSEIHRLSLFTTDRGRIKTAVDALEPDGSTCFYDAVADSLELLKAESGRRAVLALTDGEDTSSQSANLETVIASALGSACRCTPWDWVPRMRSRAPTSAGSRLRPGANTIPLGMPINFARFTSRSPSGSARVHAPLSKRTHRARRHPAPDSNCLPGQPVRGQGRRVHSRHGRSGRRLVAVVSWNGGRFNRAGRSSRQARSPQSSGSS